MSEIVHLTPKQRNSLHDALSWPMTPPGFAQTGTVNPKMRVFVVHFDGTQNDKDSVPEGSVATLVADSHDAMPTGAHIASTYHAGVGTRTRPLRGLVQSMMGMGAEARAEAAYVELCDQVREWKKEDADCLVHVHVVGFSRGAGTGLHFMNLVHERGVQTVWHDAHLGPGEVKTSAVLMDTVTTGNSDLKLALPDSNVATLHITAGGEERRFFPLTTLKGVGSPDEISLVANLNDNGAGPSPAVMGYQRLNEVCLEGARHSDVGGSYREGGIRNVSAYLMCEFQRNLGLPVHARKPTFEEVEHMHANDSRFLVNKMIDPFLSKEALTNAREAAMRVSVSKGARTWDGDAAIKCTMETEHGGPIGFVRHVHCELKVDADHAQGAAEAAHRTPLGQTIRETDFGQSAGLTFKRANAASPPATIATPATTVAGIEVECSDPKSLAIGPDGNTILFRGVALPAEFSVARAQEILSQTDHRQITFRIGIEKTTPVVDAAHTPHIHVAAKEPAKQPAEAHRAAAGAAPQSNQWDFQEDPWPAGVRDALYTLNASPKKLPSNANLMVFQAMDQLSHRLMRKFGAADQPAASDAKNAIGAASTPAHPPASPPASDVRSVSFRSSPLADRQGPFTIEIARADGSVLNGRSQGATAAEYALLAEIQSMQQAMAMLTGHMHRNGHGSPRVVHQVFSRDRQHLDASVQPADPMSGANPDGPFSRVRMPPPLPKKDKTAPEITLPDGRTGRLVIPGLGMVARLSQSPRQPSSGGRAPGTKPFH